MSIKYLKRGFKASFAMPNENGIIYQISIFNIFILIELVEQTSLQSLFCFVVLSTVVQFKVVKMRKLEWIIV